MAAVPDPAPLVRGATARPRSWPLPAVPGALSGDEVAATAGWIASLQRPSGMIPWFPGGHCDPWNHVEAAMALAVAGLLPEAERAYDWLAATQRPDGSWHNYYVEVDGRLEVEDAKLDTNVCAYVATGVWQHWLLTGDEGFVAELWPVVAAAMDFVVSLQTERGEIVWAREVDEQPWTFALLTGSSSIVHALGCAVRLAQVVGEVRPRWQLAEVSLATVIREHEHVFAPKRRWAMDWYYPVLAGVLTGEAARARLARRWDEFVMPGLGVRCVHDEPWVTAAETAECALAHVVAGLPERATALLAWTGPHRGDDGSYLTGLVHPERLSFPGNERTAYTAAAIVLAADALAGASPAAGLFAGPAGAQPSAPGGRSAP